MTVFAEKRYDGKRGGQRGREGEQGGGRGAKTGDERAIRDGEKERWGRGQVYHLDCVCPFPNFRYKSFQEAINSENGVNNL